MKINCHGMELETITEGYWPEGVTLVGENNRGQIIRTDVVCLHNGRCFFENGKSVSYEMSNWAILPPKPAPRRLTNREVAKLCRAGWDACVCGTVSSAPEYSIHDESEEVQDTMLRSPNTDKWLEPTSDLLEVVDNG